MYLPLWLALVLAQAPAPPSVPDVQAAYRSEAYDFEISLPKGWESIKAGGSTFFRIVAPAGTLAEGAVSLSYKDSNQPVTLEFLAEAFRRHAAKDYNGFKNLSERNLTAGGWPAQQFIFTAVGKSDKELVFVQTVIQRQLQEFFTLLVLGASAEREKVLALSDRILAGFKTGLGPSKEREDAVRRTWETLKAEPVRSALAGTQWHVLIVGMKKLGWQKTVLREAKIEGVAGWEFEIECRQEDAEGGTRTDLSKGSFSADGSVQRVVYSRAVRTAKDPPIDIRETSSLVRGAYKTAREFLDQKLEKEFKAPEGTLLGDVAEIYRRLIALAPKGKHSLRILEPFHDIPLVEEWENIGRSTVPLDGKDEDLVQALATAERQQPTEYLFDPDGTLRRRKGSGGFIVLKRSTEAEALKK